MQVWGMQKGTDPINLRPKGTGMPDSRKILLVDDDLDHLSICKLVLTNRGYDVLVLWNTDVLLEVVKDFLPGVIFMDHRMPARNGIEATQLLKSNEATRAIPVVYFTGVDGGEELSRQAGADAFLAKPFNIDSLISMVNRFVP
jgi:two-component system cell cycle response regulator DivK